MIVDVRIDAKRLQTYIKRAMKDMPQEIDNALYKTGQQGVNLILDRTEKGVGTDGLFKRYTPEYAKSKANGWPVSKTRRAFSGDSSGIVNLMVSGNMLGSMIATKPKNHRTKITFSRSVEAKKAFWNNRQRKFFEFNQKEVNKLGDFFRKELFS